MTYSKINIIYAYLPVILLILIAPLKNRFEPENEALKRQNWSLIFGIAIVVVNTTSYVILSFCYRILLNNYDQNMFNWTLGLLITLIFTIVFVYYLLRLIYKVSIIEIFNLKRNYLPFILKLGAVYTLIIVLGYYFVGLDLSDQQELKALKSMDAKNLTADVLLGLVVGPIAEETIYRGILYVPLYRKVGKHLAMLLTSFAWTSGHSYSVSINIGIFIFGLILAWLYNRSGSLLHPIIFHMCRNNWLIYYILPAR